MFYLLDNGQLIAEADSVSTLVSILHYSKRVCITVEERNGSQYVTSSGQFEREDSVQQLGNSYSMAFTSKEIFADIALTVFRAYGYMLIRGETITD